MQELLLSMEAGLTWGGSSSAGLTAAIGYGSDGLPLWLLLLIRTANVPHLDYYIIVLLRLDGPAIN